MASLLGLCLFAAAAVTHGQTDFFWSAKPLNQGATNAPVHEFYEPGDIGTLYLYYTIEGPSAQIIDVGATIDIGTSEPGIIRFITAETLNFEILIQGFPIGNRWGSPIEECETQPFGQTGDVSDDFVNELTAFGSNGMDGLAINKIILDSGYDHDAEAYLFAKLDFEVIGEVGKSVDLMTATGSLRIAHSPSSSNTELLEPEYGDAKVTIGEFIEHGDINLDGDIDLLDVQPFGNLVTTSTFQAESDTDCDGTVDILDVNRFVNLLLGPEPLISLDHPGNQLGDVNCDGVIDLRDYGCMMFLHVDCPCFQFADINQDGSIDLLYICPFIEILLQQK